VYIIFIGLIAINTSRTLGKDASKRQTKSLVKQRPKKRRRRKNCFTKKSYWI